MIVPAPVLAAIRQPAFLYDARGRIAEANDRAEALAARPLTGCTAAEIIATFSNRHPDGTPFVPGTLPPTRALAGEDLVDLPMVVTAADGRVIHLLVTASPIRDGDAIAGALVVWQDISAQKRVEEALRESGQRQAFLLALGDRLREHDGVRELMAGAAEMLGRHLGASGVVYCEVDEAGECASVRADWNDGTVPSAEGRFRMDDFGIGDLYRRGGVRRTSDVTTALSGDEVGEHCALRIRSSLGVPVLHGGALSAVLAVRSSRPRDWTDAEVELVREAGDRIWNAVERAKADEALRTREQQLELALEAGGAGMWIRTPDGDWVATSRLNALFGRPPDGPPLRENDYPALILPDDLPTIRDAWAEAIGGRADYDQEYRVVWPDGSLHWLASRGRAVADAAGATRLIGITYEITGRKEAEAALLQAAERTESGRRRLETILETIPSAVIIVEAADGRLSFQNRRATELYGRSFVGCTVDRLAEAVRLLRPDRTPFPVREMPGMRSLASGEAVRNAEVLLEPAGRPAIPIVVSAAPLRDAAGRTTAAVVTFDDITGRKRTEERLRASEEVQALLAEVAARLLAAEDPQGVIDDLCRRALRVLDCDVFFNYLAHGDRLVLNAYAGIPPEVADTIRLLDSGAAVCGCAARDGRRVVAEAIPEHPDPRTDLVAGYGVRAFACHPLVVAGRTLGTLSFGTTTRDRFTADDLSTMKAIADLIAVAMQRIADRDALRAGEERLRLAQESAGVGIYDRDAATDRVTISPLFLARYGVPAGACACYRDFVWFIHPDDRDRVEAERRSALDAGLPLDLEFRVRVPSGETVWLQFRGRGIRDGRGALARVIGVLTDVTERRRAEAALRASEAQFRRALEDAPIPIIMHAEDGQVLQLSRTWTELTGYGPEDVPTFDAWLTRAYGEGADAVRDHVHSLFRGDRRTIGIEFPIRTRDGEQRYWSFSASSPGTLADGRRYVVGMAVDITGRRRREMEIRHQEAVLAGIARILSAALVAGTEGALGEVCLAVAEAITGSRVGFIAEVAPDGLQEIAFHLGGEEGRSPPVPGGHRGSSGMATLRGLFGAVIRDGRTLCTNDPAGHPDSAGLPPDHPPLSAFLGVPLVRDGTTVGLIAVANREGGYTDEERRRLEAIAPAVVEAFDRKRAEQALKTYAERLATSNEELQRFAYVASHDLQEPLRSIVSFSELLERRYRGKLDQDADEFIGFIVEGGTRMQRLIQDLLTFSRVETLAGTPVPTDPREAVGAARRLFEASLEEVGARLEVGELPPVVVDPGQLEQVFANLLGNAVKYRHPERPLAIAISARRLDGMVEFAVADNGIGIEEQYFDRIFEMFRRLHTKDQYDGTGIGLALVKRIVERHGGTVRVESTPGEGTTFFFTLPAT